VTGLAQQAASRDRTRHPRRPHRRGASQERPSRAGDAERISPTLERRRHAATSIDLPRGRAPHHRGGRSEDAGDQVPEQRRRRGCRGQLRSSHPDGQGGSAASTSRSTRPSPRACSISRPRISQRTRNPASGSTASSNRTTAASWWFAGGVPLKRDGAVVGAVGVSGGTGEATRVSFGIRERRTAASTALMPNARPRRRGQAPQPRSGAPKAQGCVLGMSSSLGVKVPCAT